MQDSTFAEPKTKPWNDRVVSCIVEAICADTLRRKSLGTYSQNPLHSVICDGICSFWEPGVAKETGFKRCSSQHVIREDAVGSLSPLHS